MVNINFFRTGDKHRFTLNKARTCSSTCFRMFCSWNKSNKHSIQSALCKTRILPSIDIVTYSIKRLKANSVHIRASSVLPSIFLNWEPSWLIMTLEQRKLLKFRSSCAWRQAALRTLVITSKDSNEARVCSVASCRITRKLLRRVLTAKGSEMQCSSASSSAEHSGYNEKKNKVEEIQNKILVCSRKKTTKNTGD